MNQEIRPMPTCLYQLLEIQAEKNPNAIAITAPGREPLTYGKLWDTIQNIVAGLNAIGVGRNDRVAVALANGPEMAVAFLGIASGATCAPLNPAYRTNEFDFYLSDLNAKALIIQSGVAETAVEVARKRGIPIIELSPVKEAETGIFSLTGGEAKPAKQAGLAVHDDIALVLHTSGTTSRPKIVPLTHSNLCASAQNIRSSLQLDSGDCCLNVMPLFHIHGLIGALLSSLSAGASVVCTPGFYAPKFFEWLDEFRPTWYTAVPTMHQAILARAAANAEIIARCGIRLIRSSSAALPPQVMAEIERTFSAPVIEAYGMTEASHQMASNPLPPRARKAGSVGVAAGPTIAIMDESGNVLSAGETGEIVIRGASVTAGYENNPKANESAFTQGWFRTGDQGYLDSDGYLFIKGRIKELINRGGEKISPREVDEVLLNHPAVAQAVTFALPHPQLGEDVGAAVVLRENSSVTEREIQEFAAAQLADFKVPRRVIFLEEIPKGPTGKLQRIGLAEKLGIAADEPAESLTAFAPPSTVAEEKLAAIWSEVLGIEKVGVRDNFFELGGDSILAAQIVNRVRSEMQVELSFLDLWQNPTVAGMAAETTRKQGVPAAPIQRISREGELPLSFAQAQIWFFEQLEPENTAFNRPVALRLTGKLNVAALEQSLNEIVRRHEVLRASFPAVDGVPVQAIAPNLSLSLPVTDISDLPDRERKAEAQRRVTEDAQRPFDLARGPLVRATLLRLSSEDHRLLLAMHHTVFDGWSVGVLLQEVAALYEAFSTGNPSPLPELPVQYADFTVWQQQWLSGEVLESQLAYWKKQLAGANFVLELPADRLRPAVQTYRGAKHSFMLPVSLGESLKKLSQQEKVTLFVTLLAAFATLLYRYTGQDDVIIGTPIAGRNRIETEKLIGVFINTLVLRTNLGGNPSFRELLGRVGEVALGALAHQDLPFEKLVEELHPQRDLSRSPVFQVIFQLKNLPSETGDVRGLTIEEFDVDTGAAKVDLNLEIVEKPSGLSCVCEYSTDLFDDATIERMGGHFQTLLEGIVANPERRVSDLPLLTEAERHQLLVEWNQTRADYPRDKCVHEMFEEQVERTPDAVAVVFENRHLTYRELNQRANQLAHHLQELGAGPEVLVGICLERSLEMVVGLLGILKAGGAYVPLDPAYPPERLSFMLSDSKLLLAVTHSSLEGRFDFGGKTRLVCLDTDWPAIASKSQENPTGVAKPENLAYAIYTSGSTGIPKGVTIEHRALSRFVKAAALEYQLSERDRVLQFASINFDAAAEEIYPCLTCGGTLVLRTDQMLSGASVFLEKCSQLQLTVLDLPTAYWHQLTSELATAQLALPESLRLTIIGGEKALPERVGVWQKVAGNRSHLANGYGPTEATVVATIYKVPAAAASGGLQVPVGRPLPHVQTYILDGNLQPVPAGVPGELHLGGDSLARGYLNCPELTAEKFIPNPFSNQPGARLYKTGDLARYLPDGNIEVLGRTDSQVKIRGFRIELGEIEAVLTQHPGVRETAVTAREDTPGDKRLVAYIVPADIVPADIVPADIVPADIVPADIVPAQSPNPPIPAQNSTPSPSLQTQLRSFLKEKLPDYMVPSAFVTLDALPVTPNGKIDRRALPAPELQPAASESGFTAPRDTLEIELQSIWEKVLGVRPISVTDNFFDLGGHSLLAVRLFAQIKERFNRDLPLATLFQAPTVEQLAGILRQKGWVAPSRSLVAIQAGGTKKPLFCVHAVGGNVLSYQNLAYYLGKDRPVYGLQSRGLDGQTEPHTKIEDMAADYIKEMRTVQPHGPYFIAGYSSGGVVAFEIAQQLVAAGEKVALLALLDTSNPLLYYKETPPLSYQLYIHWLNLNRLEPKQKLNYFVDLVIGNSQGLMEKIAGKFYQWTGRALPNSGELPELFRRIEEVNRLAVRNYVPKRYSGKVTLLRAIERPTRKYYDPYLGWGEIAAGGVEIVEVPGHHKTLILEPCVRFLAEKLREYLDK
jgi:amino acid adenylation domain-containing protein